MASGTSVDMATALAINTGASKNRETSASFTATPILPKELGDGDDPKARP